MAGAPVSVVILAKNEGEVIARAILSVPFADEVVVVDSESTDDTRSIAEALGAKVVVQSWLGWLGQKDVAVRACRNDWIFSLDADEIVTPELARSIQAAMAADPDPVDGYVLERKEEFLGEIMPSTRRASKRKSFVRLFNRTRSGFDPALVIHEEIRCPGRLIPIEGALLHWRNYTIGRQLDTLNRNADLEADMIVERGGPSIATLIVKPPLRFLWIYVACGLWRSGVRGLSVAGLHSFAEFLRHAKAWEKRNAPRRAHPTREVYDGPLSYPVTYDQVSREDVEKALDENLPPAPPEPVSRGVVA